MMVLAIILTLPPKIDDNTGQRSVDGLGVLELTWLLGRDPEGIAKRLAALNDPTPAHLRELGKGIPVAFCE